MNNRQLSECCNKAQGNYSSFSTGETATINVNVTNIFNQLTDSTPKDSADTATAMEDIQTKIQFKRKKNISTASKQQLKNLKANVTIVRKPDIRSKTVGNAKIKKVINKQ